MIFYFYRKPSSDNSHKMEKVQLNEEIEQLKRVNNTLTIKLANSNNEIDRLRQDADRASFGSRKLDRSIQYETELREL